jgi:hypothetical protein
MPNSYLIGHDPCGKLRGSVDSSIDQIGPGTAFC